ncbi:MAG: hypothetical protein PHP36_04615 [Atribacterota bacterium]|jgi:hypothetical protein|nr:hypothetical protein [Atribacterota bacterium]MDD5497694.1 hypothetical protein [Atribacterota bacterium]
MNNISGNDFRNFIISPQFASKIKDIEKSINSLNGVLFSKIVLADNKEIKEIHVITKDFYSPKKISRDVESLLMAKYNISIDYRKISIAQVTEEKNHSPRLKFVDLLITSQGDHLEVLVKLENNDKQFEGKVDCVNWDKNREYIVSRATLEAITSFLKGKVFFQVEEIKKINMDEREVVLVAINLINEQGKENLIGAALIGDDPHRSLVKAILKAVNRRILVK